MQLATEGQRTAGWWAVAWAVALVYTAVYGWQISRHAAVPYWDQTNYVWKVYAIAERWQEAGGTWAKRVERLNPGMYLEAEPPMRPPLMMLLPAAIWGRHAQPQNIAYSWLAIRMAALIAGVWVLARTVGSAHWVPGALCVMLGSHGFLKVNQNLYLMDLAFASFGLLAFALIARAMVVRAAAAAALAAAGGVALVLVKPQGLAFLFPFYAVLAIERGVYEARTWRLAGETTRRRKQLLSLGGFVLVLGAMVLVFLYLITSRYGGAVAAQHAWGSQGFWKQDMDGPTLWAILTGVLPPWLAGGAVVASAAHAVRRAGAVVEAGLPRRVWILAAAGIASWLVFNLEITYAIDPRLIWSVGPIVMALALVLMCHGRRWAVGATVFAATVFGLAVGITAFGWPAREWASPWLVLGPQVAKQTLVAEVGIRPLVAAVEREVRKHVPAPHSVAVMTLMSDEYVEYAGMSLAARWANGDQWSSVRYEQFPWGADGFEMAGILGDPAPGGTGWFLTKQNRQAPSLRADAFANMHAIEALIVDPASPGRGIFEAVTTMPIRQPLMGETPLLGSAPEGWLDDSVTLWRQTRKPTAEETLAALAFVEPRYRGMAGEKRMAEQRAALERVLGAGTSVT